MNGIHVLKEKLPQAVMQVGGMEDDFRNLTAKVWANLDNPIKRWFFKVFIKFVYVALSGGTLLISLMSQQYNCLMELYTNFYKMLLFIFVQWRVVLLWYHIFWQSSIQRGRHTQLCIITSLKWIIWVCKIAFYSPNPHCCLGKLPL